MVILACILTFFFKKYVSVIFLDDRSTQKIQNTSYKHFYENSINKVKTDNPQWLQKKVLYQHNNDGLNNIRDYSLNKKANITRIIALGDSFTYGIYVNTQDNWVSLLQKKLNAQECGKRSFEVLNFGVPGYDVDYALERSRLRGEKYRPDLYVWFIKDDDFSDSKELSTPIEQTIFKNGIYTTELYKQAMSLLFEENNKEDIIRAQSKHLEEYIKNNPKTKFLFIFPKGTTGYPSIQKNQEEHMYQWKNRYKNVDFFSIEITRKEIFAPYDYHFNERGHILFSDKVTQKISRQYCL